jgi:hypothetical protein
MDKKSLVEDEGVNAGSAQQLAEPDADAAATNPRSGGHPEDVEAKAPVGDLDPDPQDDSSELLGAPDERSGYPGQEHGSSGQDAGSIE